MGILTKKQQKLYNSFYESTHENDYLDNKTEILVGLAASMAMNCAPCTNYYLKMSKEMSINKGEIFEVLAKVMAVSAGQKRLQVEEVIKNNEIDIESY
ncbi:MAG: carboxymuconolactone decarboxylase family protein [Methylococcales bacterium]|nr:carboxymuconolactone decarboxylase family protein [Methylococcales bacterium]